MDQVAKRAEQLYQRFFSSLDQGKYLWDSPDSREKFAFTVSQRGVAGKKYSRAGGITSKQLRFIATTIEDDDEAVAKIHDVVIKGEKINQSPPRPSQLAINPEALERMIGERVAAALAAIEQSKAARAAPQPEELEPEFKTPKLISTEADTFEYDTWLQRAAAIGMGVPRRRPTDPSKVDGRWLKYNLHKWVAHEQRKADAAQ